MIELYMDIQYLKMDYCQIDPSLKLHISRSTIFDTMHALAFRPDFDQNKIKRINKMLVNIL